MCGIFAYINYGVPVQQKAVVEKLLNGLRRLEYRGYDSAGIAVDNGPTVNELSQVVMKSTGKIDKLAEVVRDASAEDAAFHEPTPPHFAPPRRACPILFFLFFNFFCRQWSALSVCCHRSLSVPPVITREDGTRLLRTAST